MNPEKRAKRQSIRIIVSETIMVLSVILLVTILALLVSGYWLNSDFKVERQGMLQISSEPSGATVDIDGDAPWFQRTNTSKVLSAGEHTITLTKDGYDSWSKTVSIREGLLYRIHYPRLFLTERKPTPVYDLAGTTFATISPDHTKLLLANTATSWQLIDLTQDQLSAKPLSIASILSPEATTFTGTIIEANWDHNNTHVLMKIQHDASFEWILLNTGNPREHINLSLEFPTTDFTDIEILDNSASTLLIVSNGNLHKLDLPSRQISDVLIKDIYSYDHYGNEIIYSTKSPTTQIVTGKTDTIPDTTNSAPTPSYEIGLLNLGSPVPKSLFTRPTATKVFISHFYDDKYLTLLSASDSDSTNVTIYKKDNLAETFRGVINMSPNTAKIGYDGEFIIMLKDASVATLDMESLTIREWTLDSASYGWLDDNMLYTVINNNLIVYDYDGLNRRPLADSVSPSFPATVSDNKWLYYASNGKLTRERIAK